MAPARPSQEEDEEDLAAFELPLLQRLSVQLWAMVLGLSTRLADAVLWVGRPALVRPYVGLWLAEWLRSPYRARRSFQVVLAPRATGQRLRELIYGAGAGAARGAVARGRGAPPVCGGLLASGELFREVAEVLFRERLHAEPP